MALVDSWVVAAVVSWVVVAVVSWVVVVVVSWLLFGDCSGHVRGMFGWLFGGC